MNYQVYEDYEVYDLGQLKSQDIVKVTLSNEAYVRLMDSSNYQIYKSGGNCGYIGGFMTEPTIKLGVALSGHYYVTIDMRGLQGTVRSAVKVLPNTLP